MEIKEAIAHLREYQDNSMVFSELVGEEKPTFVEALELAISALEKQKAKKPLPVSNDSTWSKCPVCGGTNIDEYCGKCGQRIEWSE